MSKTRASMSAVGETWAKRVKGAVDASEEILHPLVGRDWRAQAGALQWSCAQTAIHLANDLAKYASQLAGRVDNAYLRVRLAVAPDETPAEILRILGAAARLLIATVETAPHDARAWHWGTTDRSGFAAMGVGELLVHTFDITSGLGVDWRPPGPLAEVVLARLMPDLVHDDAPEALLWATGRLMLNGRPNVTDWVWRPATYTPAQAGDT